MTDGVALLRAVIEAPDDDAPRLVYADWLDGIDRAVTDECPIQPERAEFIRVQVELARLVRRTVRLADGITSDEVLTKDEPRYKQLRARERELLTEPRHFVNWTPSLFHTGSGAGIRCTNPPTVELTGKGFVSVKFRRGFVEAVTCAARAWICCPLFSSTVRDVTFVGELPELPAKTVGTIGDDGRDLYECGPYTAWLPRRWTNRERWEYFLCHREDGPGSYRFGEQSTFWPGVTFHLPPEVATTSWENLSTTVNGGDIRRAVEALRAMSRPINVDPIIISPGLARWVMRTAANPSHERHAEAVTMREYLEAGRITVSQYVPDDVAFQVGRT